MPWTESPTIMNQAGYLCKEMQVMPSMGSWATELVVAGVYLLKMPVMLVMNLGAVYELLEVPDKRCSLERGSRRNSFYRECGTQMLDLSDFFSALHRANAHGWSLLDFIGSVLGLISDNEAVQVVQTILSGARQYSENQILLGYTSVSRSWMELMQAFKSQNGDGDGAPGGMQSLYFSSILNTGSPQFMAGLNIAASPIAYAEYFYRVFTRVVDRIAVLSRTVVRNYLEEETRTVTGASVWYNISTIFYESIREDWEELISVRTRRACAGLSLMVGYTNPWARFLRHWCLAGTEFTSATMKGVGSFLVEVPLVVCVCIDSNEHNFNNYMRERCIPETAPSLRPMIVTMLSWANDLFVEGTFDKQQLMKSVCNDTLNAFEDNLLNLFSPWALQHREAAAASIELFDYLGVLLGQDSAECVNFEANPYSSVMIPSPVDYFRVCGGTTSCHTKCAPFSNALKQEIEIRNGDARSPALSFTTSLESAMFKRFGFEEYQEDFLSLVSMMELSPNVSTCSRCQPNAADCVGIIGIPFPSATTDASEIKVRAYCIPYNFNEFVYMSQEWAITDAPGVPVSSILDRTSANKLVRSSFSVPHGDHVLLLSEIQNYIQGNTFYTKRFQTISVWRPIIPYRTQTILNSGTLRDRCLDIILASIGNRDSSKIDPESSKPVDTSIVYKSSQITDYLAVVSSEYTIDLVVRLQVTFSRFAVGLSERVETKSIYVRVGWCEHYSSVFTGIKRKTPSQCTDITQSGMECLGIEQSIGVRLFEEWLTDGYLVYLPQDAQYIWVPTAKSASSSLPHVYPVTLNLTQSKFVIDVRKPHMPLRARVTGGEILGSVSYVDAGSQRITPLSYSPLMHSAVAHHVPDTSSDSGRLRNVGVWYKASSTTIARTWLADVRYEEETRYLRSLSSRRRSVDVEVQRYCNGHVCSGCKTSRLRQLCLAMQSCVISNCVGSVVNQGDLLCNLGLVLESSYNQATSVYLAVWKALVSIMLSIMESQTHVSAPYEVRVEWASDIVYNTLCETKDLLASITGLVAVLVNRIDRKVTGISDMNSATLVNYNSQNAKEVNSYAYENKVLQAASIHQLLFQMSLAPMYFTFAAHRWIVCSINDIVNITSSGKFQLSLGEMGNMPPDGSSATWPVCSNAAMIEQIISSTSLIQASESLTRVLDTMTDENTIAEDASGLAGKIIGKSFRPFDYMVQVVDAMAAWSTGVVVGIQDIIYTADKSSCRVADVSIADGVQCACGDTPSYIVPELRAQNFESAAFWCSGVLHLPFNNGEFGYVYNPYSLKELGDRLQDMTAYLKCISSSSISTETVCVEPKQPDPQATSDSEFLKLREDYERLYPLYLECLNNNRARMSTCDTMRPIIPEFDSYGISSMSILTRCRSNYMQKQWDSGTGLLFQKENNPLDKVPGFVEAREKAWQWAERQGAEMMRCVSEHVGLSTFDACLDVFLRNYRHTSGPNGNVLTGIRRETYFAYKDGWTDEKPSGNPDACVLFSGPASSAGSEETKRLFKKCTADSGDILGECELPALAWAGRMTSRTPVASVHRDAIVSQEKRQDVSAAMYAAARADIVAAFEALDQSSLDALDVLFFSAEGDILHQMLDCMFLGPYSKIDYVVTDANEVLQPLRWYRDAKEGESREFDLPCTGDKLHGDAAGPPFTCGSPARRAIIKKYVRNYMFGTGNNTWDASSETARLVREKIQQLQDAYLNTTLYGCRGSTGTISVENCGDPLFGGVGFKPALPDFNEVSTSEVVKSVFRRMPTFFQEVMTNSSMWNEFYTDNSQKERWGQWKGNNIAAENFMYSPHEPIVSYNATEVLDTRKDDEFKTSVWGICASLLAQPMMTIPLIKYEEDWTHHSDATERPQWMPKGIREGTIPAYDSFVNSQESPDADFEWFSLLMHDAWLKSPMYMHYITRYSPSMSRVCENSDFSDLNNLVNNVETGTAANLSLSRFKMLFAASQETEDAHDITQADENAENLNAAEFRGYDTLNLGDAEIICPCGHMRASVTDSAAGAAGAAGVSSIYECIINAETCEHISSTPATTPNSLVAICSGTQGGRYAVDKIPVVLHELNTLFPTHVSAKCREFWLTEQWGLFEFSDNREKNSHWPATAQDLPGTPASVDAATLMAKKPIGITPANFHVVNKMTRDGAGWSHASRSRPLADKFGGSVAQKHCVDKLQTPDPHDLLDDFFESLFPVAQLVREPVGSSVCTRYVLERHKLYFMENVLKITNIQRQKTSVARWKDICDIKIKQTATCKALGVLSIAPPRHIWEAATPSDCKYDFNFTEWEAKIGSDFYVTPSCVLFVDGEFYDLHSCVAVNGNPPALLPSHITDACKMRSLTGKAIGNDAFSHNPLSITSDSNPVVLHWGNGAHLRKNDSVAQFVERIEERQKRMTGSALGVDISRAFLNSLYNSMASLGSKGDAGPQVFGNTPPGECREGFMECKTAMFCDKIVDWWPEAWQQPHGYHPTPTCKAADNAARSFDSYMSIDKSDPTSIHLNYEHSHLRDASLYYQWAGAGGICRLHNINQPLLQTNTHRFCTRASTSIPNPVLPYESRSSDDSPTFFPEKCGPTPQDVPWTVESTDTTYGPHPQTRTMGGVIDFLRATEKNPNDDGRVAATAFFPVLAALLRDGNTVDVAEILGKTPVRSSYMPKAGIVPTNVSNPWGECVPPQETLSCDVGRPNECPASMSCVQTPGREQGSGICLSTANIQLPAVTPCYTSEMCPQSSYCLAEGVCGDTHIHLWNLGEGPIEFSSFIQDTCGERTAPTYPATQTFEGASPWETVPDLLQTNGMCAQRHRYSYLYTTKFRVDTEDPDAGESHGFINLEGSGEEARVPWEWVQQTPSGRLLDESRKTANVERDRRTLHVYPHTCDQSYMHMQDFKVCSGAEGDRNTAMFAYPVSRSGQASQRMVWAAEAWQKVEGPAVTLQHAEWSVLLTHAVGFVFLTVVVLRRLRTTKPNARHKVRVNLEFASNDFVKRGPFSFLGGDKNASMNTYAYAVGNSKASFLPCINIDMCGLPTFYFAGKAVERKRIDPVSSAIVPFEMEDYNLCGSIGYRKIKSDGSVSECYLDLDLFPHIRLIATESSAFCLDLFGAPSAGGANSGGIDVISLVANFDEACSPGVVCCTGRTPADALCKYLRIGNTAGLNLRPVFNTMLAKINNIITLVTTPHAFYEIRDTTIGAGIVIECIEDLMRANAMFQRSLQVNYETETHSGVYYALGYYLYEVPFLWYYKWIYKTLVWPTETSPFAVTREAENWNRIIDLGEAWDSRASIFQSGMRRCKERNCVCQQQAAGTLTKMKDRLLCINTAPRLRIETTFSQSLSSQPAAVKYYSDVLDEYLAALRREIMSRVLDHIRSEFGIVATDPSTYVPGCYTKAYWKREKIEDDVFWLDHLQELLSGKEGPDLTFQFTPNSPDTEDYFEFEDFVPGSSKLNMLSIVRDIVSSYEFLDPDFDAMRDGVLFQPDESTLDSVIQWYYPIFKLRKEAGITEAYDNLVDQDDTLNGVTFTPQPANSGNLECVFKENQFNPLENIGDPEAGTRPIVRFSNSELPGSGQPFELDVCDSTTAKREYVKSDVPGLRLNTNPIMSCIFESQQSLHGRDVCDATVDATCTYEMKITEHGGLPLWAKLTIAVLFPPTGAIIAATIHGVESTQHYEAEMTLKADCTVNKLYEFPGAQAPDMLCKDSPTFDETCKRTPMSDEYVGGYDRHFRRSGTESYDLHFAFPKETWKSLKKGESSPHELFRLVSASPFWAETLGRGPNATEALAAHIELDGKNAKDGTFETTCMLRPGDNVEHPTPMAPPYGIPQEQPLNSMCHKINTACTPERFIEDYVTEAGCQLKYAKTPPGVALRFFASDDDVHREKTSDGNPVWPWCPNDPVDEFTQINGVSVPRVRKSVRGYYPRYQNGEPAFSCTEQYDSRRLKTECGFGNTEDDEDGCYIVGKTESKEWYFSKTRSKCRTQTGACSYSMTLAKNYFCGTGTVDRKGKIVPPSNKCDSKTDRKVLVRGEYTDKRSLWKCAPCLKFNPLRYTGRMKCGIQVSGSTETAELRTAEIVQSVKNFIRTQIHSVEKFGQIHEQAGLSFNTEKSTLRFDSDTSVVYAALHETTASTHFSKWEGVADGDCQASRKDVDPVAETCTWDVRYDITQLANKDRFYTERPENLQCVNKVPKDADYATCSKHSNAPRTMLKNWVENHYKKEQGAWLPVLPAEHGVSWRADSSGLSNAFTLFFASNIRPETQVHVRNILGDKICRSGTHLTSICASLTSAGTQEYVHVNPWLGGEFDIFFSGEMSNTPNDDIMGLDQCKRVGGQWQTCCRCFPKSICCYPDEVCQEERSDTQSSDNYFTQTQHVSACNPRELKRTGKTPINDGHATNICTRNPFDFIPPVCTHHQGVVGTNAGTPIPDLRSLYHEKARETPTSYFVEDFLVAAESVLWAGGVASDSSSYMEGRAHLLRMPRHLIYPAHLVFTVGNTGSILRAHGMQMQRGPEETLYSSKTVNANHRWVPTLQADFVKDFETIAKLYPILVKPDQSGNGDWSCPLKLMAFWGQDSVGFNPLVPDPIRSDFMFRGKYYCRTGIRDNANNGCIRGIHPFHRPIEYRGLRNFYTSDGRCYFDLDSGNDPNTVTEGNKINSWDTANECGLTQQLLFAMGSQEQQLTKVVETERKCQDILDW